VGVFSSLATVALVAVLSGAVAVVCAGIVGWLYRREAARSGQRNRAEQRAQDLLERLLTPLERECLRRAGYLEVSSRLVPGRIYRVPGGRRQVQVLDQGQHTGSLCIQPACWVPEGDVILMHKLMIEGSEADYLKTANLFQVRA
jgi:hypothetical protein